MCRYKRLFLIFFAFFVGGGFFSTSVYAQDVVAPQTKSQIMLSFSPIVKQVAPAVVNIYTSRVVNSRLAPFMDDQVFSLLFGGQGLSRQRVENSLGSGVIVSKEGLVITNRHVIEDAQEIRVILHDRSEYPAQIISIDERTDLAILKIKAPDRHQDFPVLAVGDSDSLEVGDLVLAIGNPFGVGQTVTSGIVSATARTAEGINDYGYFIQTDAAINPGNSGGALVNMSGQLIGINTAIYSQSGGSLGIGFAIPANLVRSVIDAGLSGKRLIRPWLGAGVQTLTSELAQSLGMDRPMGVLVKSLHDVSPLREAGLVVGDVILTINNKPVDNPEALQFRMGTLSIGQTARITYTHQKKMLETTFNLIAPPEVPARDTFSLDRASVLSGITVANLSPAVAEEIGFYGALNEGVIVMAVKAGSAADSMGLKAGDVVIAINREMIASVQEFKTVMQSISRAMLIKVLRNGQIISAVIRR